jgi:hypothetical protein
LRWLVILVEALLISTLFLYLSEYFGWNLYTEAGGASARQATSSE